MESMASASSRLMIIVGMLGILSTTALRAQECSGLPAIPDATITTTQDRDQMMCQQGLTFPTLPTLQGTAWPWNDPTAPTNAWPVDPTNPSGNWTDAQGHVVIRTEWGNWHTYDAGRQFEPSPAVHFPNIPAAQNGGARSVALRHTPMIVARCYVAPSNKGKQAPVVVTYGENTFQYTAQYGISVCAYDPAPFSFPPFFVDNTPPIQPDSGGANLSDYVIGLKNKGNWRKPDDPGALVIWGWGVSRLIDYFGTDPDFNADKVAVEGHSRYGKSALVAGAYDDRIAVTWPSDAGQMGTALARRTYGETIDFVSSTPGEYHWLAGAAMNYAGRLFPHSLFPRRAELLDVDAQSTESLIAPRAIFVTNGTDTPAGVGDAWADPRGCFLSAFLSAPVWSFLGWQGLVIPAGTPFTTDANYTPPAGCTQCDKAAEGIGGTPAFDTALIEGTVGWRRQKEGHTPVPNWPSFMIFASRYLNDGRPVIAPNQVFTLEHGHSHVVGTVKASDPDDGDKLQDWQIKGGSGAYRFSINSASGQISVADERALERAHDTSYDLVVMVGDGKLPSHDAVVRIVVRGKHN